MKQRICGLFISEYESIGKAQAAVDSMKNCPHLLFAGTASNQAHMTFIVPESMRWWFEVPAENPELLGAKRVDIVITEEIAYPEEFKLRVPETKLDTPPCGSKCRECPMREKYNCPGCPAIV